MIKDMRVMLSLYKSLVRPHTEYCISAWNPHYKKDKELIEKVQTRFTKMINNMEGKLYEERLYWLKLNKFFTLADNTRGITRHSRKLVKFQCTRDCFKYFFQTE